MFIKNEELIKYVKTQIKKVIKSSVFRKIKWFFQKKITKSVDSIPVNEKTESIKKIFLEDENIMSVDMTSTLKQIAENHVFSKPLDFIYAEIATFLLNVGHPQFAEIYFKRSLDLKFTQEVYSLYLQCLLLDPSCKEEKMLAAASKYEVFFEGIKKFENHKNTLDPHKKLNIGYLCHFFHNSVSQALLMPFIKAHNSDRVKVFCYSDADPSEVSEDIKNCANVWRDTKNLNDEELSSLIREDQIDILLELNGHCFSNRYGVISRKSAPVQINYYNHSATTGLSALDYILVGEGITLDQSHYSESIYKMKGIQGISIFPESFPPVLPAPYEKNGYITFGSFGAAHKVNTEVVKLWCKILNEIPDAKFFMKAGVLGIEDYLKVYKKLFREGGIDLSRIYFEGFSEHHTMLKRYANVDIALDTFPHAAGTTTMEALFQGVPVITLNGEKYCSQNGRIVLTAVGHPELIAYSEDEYLVKAVELAHDKKRLTQYRESLRNDFKNSPLGDSHSFASRLEDAYFDMWKMYCNKNVVSAV